MPNRERGEVGLLVGDEEYTLRFSVGAIVEIEGGSGCPLHSVIEAAAGSTLHLSLVRLLLWGALRDRHGLSLAGVGALMSLAGPALVLEKLTAAVAAAFPERGIGDADDDADSGQADWNELLRWWMIKTGQPRDAFWISTPREVALDLDVALARSAEANQTLRWHTWHVAALSKSKKFPSFRDFVRPSEPGSAGDGPRKHQQSSDDQMAVLRQIFRGRRRAQQGAG